MGTGSETPVAYIELSVHHLEIAGRLPAGPELEQFRAHPLHDKLAEDWLAQDDPDDAAAVGLLDLEKKLFSHWEKGRRARLEEYLKGSRLPPEACDKARASIEDADKKLATRVGKSRTVTPPPVVEIDPGEPIPWPKPELSQGIAALLALMADEEAPARFETARGDTGITAEDARTAAEVLEKLATFVPSEPEPPPEPEKPTVSKAWLNLWNGPSKLAMTVLENVAVELNDLFAPHLINDDELSATPDYQEVVVRLDLGIGASPERIREKALEALRERLGDSLPVTSRVTSKVAEVLNQYFENWRLALDADKVAALVEAKRG